MKHLFFPLFSLLLHHAKSDVDLKKQSQPKSRDLRLIRWEFLGLQAQETASEVTLRELLAGWKESVYIEVCNKRRVV